MGSTLSVGRMPVWLIIAIAWVKTKQNKDESVLLSFANFANRQSGFFSNVIGIFLILGLYRRFVKAKANLFNKSWLDIKNDLGGMLIYILKKTPITSGKIKEEFSKIEQDLDKSLKKKTAESKKNFHLPAKGISHELVLSEMTALKNKEESVWKDGWVSGAVYHGGDEHVGLQNKAVELFSVSNPLHVDVWPSVMKFEAEIVQMTASLLNGGKEEVCGTMTSGGTESVIMATKTHRQWGRKVKGIHQPEIIAAQTAHVAIEKACEIMDIKVIRIPVDPVTFKVDLRKVKKALSADTIMIYSSAPQYPHGIIDDVEALSKIAQKHGCGLHVDCCLGGFVLPFAKKLGYDIPKFHFELPGVTSISVDTHKYGYAAKGTSVVLYHSKEFRRHQYFTFPNWPGGLYVTPGLPGSRPGALSAACWAGMMAMGEDGYLDSVQKIMQGQRKIKAAVEEIEGIHVLGEPIAMIVAFASNNVDVYKIGDKMHKKGWALNSLQQPPSIHICVTLRTLPKIDKFIDDLKESTKEVLADPAKDEENGSAPIYGLAQSLPAGPIEQMLETYTDVVLKV